MTPFVCNSLQTTQQRVFEALKFGMSCTCSTKHKFPLDSFECFRISRKSEENISKLLCGS